MVKKSALTLLLAVALVPVLAWAAEDEQAASDQDQGNVYAYGMMGGYGYGPGMMEGYDGYGPGVMGGYGHGMMGGYVYGPGGGQGQAQPNLTPQQQKAWRALWRKYQSETLNLRQNLVAKRMELTVLWMMPEVDQARVKALSREINDLQAELYNKRDEYLLQCRQQFGDLGWSCPGARWDQ